MNHNNDTSWLPTPYHILHYVLLEEEVKMLSDADILLDIDRKDINARAIAERMRFISVFTPFVFEKIKVLQTRKGFHIYLWCKDKKPTPMEKVIIQLALGSDYKREILNYRRIRNNKDTKRWNVLFQSKYDKNGNRISEETHSREAIRLEEEIMALYEVV